jgi:hypothetical protein
MFLAIKIYIDHVARMAQYGGAMGGGKRRDQLLVLARFLACVVALPV